MINSEEGEHGQTLMGRDWNIKERPVNQQCLIYIWDNISNIWSLLPYKSNISKLLPTSVMSDFPTTSWDFPSGCVKISKGIVRLHFSWELAVYVHTMFLYKLPKTGCLSILPHFNYRLEEAPSGKRKPAWLNVQPPNIVKPGGIWPTPKPWCWLSYYIYI